MGQQALQFFFWCLLLSNVCLRRSKINVLQDCFWSQTCLKLTTLWYTSLWCISRKNAFLPHLINATCIGPLFHMTSTNNEKCYLYAIHVNCSPCLSSTKIFIEKIQHLCKLIFCSLYNCCLISIWCDKTLNEFIIFYTHL